MTICPGCGSDLAGHDGTCPVCNAPIQKAFTIRGFLWENFRLFTMVGITGTMISLIPNTGTRVLGISWITGSDSILPFFLSVIIFFGTLFLSVCFLMIFSLILSGRKTEAVQSRISLFSRPVLTWHEGDLQRFILLAILVPMWLGLTLFFLLLMPLIPNRYSWLFAAVIGLTLIPLVVYTAVGWGLGKMLATRIFGPGRYEGPVIAVVTVLIIVIILLVNPLVFPIQDGTTASFPQAMRIKADQQYFSPGISTEKGLRLDLTNISGRETLESRHVWSADYGYFIQVTPSTSDVVILGNPAEVASSRGISWTYPVNDPAREKTPVTIRVQSFALHGTEPAAETALTLDWFTRDIIRVNRSYRLK